MQQIFTTLVTWRQLEQYLFPRLRDIWKMTPFRKPAPLDPNRNVFLREVRCLCVAVEYGTVLYPVSDIPEKGTGTAAVSSAPHFPPPPHLE